MCPEAEPKETSTVEVHKTYCFPEVSVNKYFIIYQESKKRKDKSNFIRKYRKYFNNLKKNVKFNSVHNVIHKTFAVFGLDCVAGGIRGHKGRSLKYRSWLYRIP